MTASTDLFTLVLVDGIPATVDGKTIRYREVRLRETNVNDERVAQRMAERVVHVAGKPTLLVSESEFRYALTMRHVESLRCDGHVLHQASIDLELFGKLSSHDLGLIEARVFLLTMAAELRYGNISQEDFDRVVAGEQRPAAAPQPQGQASESGPARGLPEPGPALLADFTGSPAGGAPEGDAR